MILNAAKYLYTVLEANPEVKALVGDKIFPVATIEEVDFPFIVFEVSSCTPLYAKQGLVGAENDCNVYCIGETYDESNALAEKVIAALSDTELTMDDGSAYYCRWRGLQDAFQSDTFIQVLNFDISLK